ncbi:MAG: GTPase Era [Candidatus Midichloria sp.]|uniref:GTPase Era, mitochondrial n=1 Tax=Hyalomma marginatum TaxID=34627 RepID=A0A8S4BTJ2_9ACAR|nr:GTPase Era [Hyalomma marginatum]CAG7590879.1 GTPase Era [Hyalomma marginatum]
MQKTLVIALAGCPNAGKSTLINKIVGQKIAIVTSKCQTTRFNTKGITNINDTQLVFIDTPGLFKPSRPLEKSIVKQANLGLEEADLICFIVDATLAKKQDFSSILKQLQTLKKPIILLLNKVDALKIKSELLQLSQDMNHLYNFDSTFMISAKKGTGINEMLNYMQAKTIAGPWLFDQDIASNITDRSLAEEITREALYYGLGAELPYALEVQTELWEEKEDGSVKISQVIHILKASQKKIILGTRGQKLKSIGQRAREQIAKILERNVHLFLYVKVKPDWIERSVAGFGNLILRF